MTADPVAPQQLAGYRRITRQPLRFSDTDMLGHVNNVAIAALHESARVQYGYDLAARAVPGTRPFILARLAIDFHAELHYPHDVRLGAVVLRVGRTSMTVGTGVFTDDDRCVSTALGVLVALDDDGRPAPIEGEFRTLIESELVEPS